jgi:hypothetical protein
LVDAAPDDQVEFDASADGTELPWCSEWTDAEGNPDLFCTSVTFLAPGPVGSAVLEDWNCEIIIPDFIAPDLHRNMIGFAADWARYPHVTDVDGGETGSGWEFAYDDALGQDVAVPNPALCADVESSGFGQIDIPFGCHLEDPF